MQGLLVNESMGVGTKESNAKDRGQRYRKRVGRNIGEVESNRKENREKYFPTCRGYLYMGVWGWARPDDGMRH